MLHQQGQNIQNAILKTIQYCIQLLLILSLSVSQLKFIINGGKIQFSELSSAKQLPALTQLLDKLNNDQEFSTVDKCENTQQIHAFINNVFNTITLNIPSKYELTLIYQSIQQKDMPQQYNSYIVQAVPSISILGNCVFINNMHTSTIHEELSATSDHENNFAEIENRILIQNDDSSQGYMEVTISSNQDEDTTDSTFDILNLSKIKDINQFNKIFCSKNQLKQLPQQAQRNQDETISEQATNTNDMFLYDQLSYDGNIEIERSQSSQSINLPSLNPINESNTNKQVQDQNYGTKWMIYSPHQHQDQQMYDQVQDNLDQNQYSEQLDEEELALQEQIQQLSFNNKSMMEQITQKIELIKSYQNVIE